MKSFALLFLFQLVCLIAHAQFTRIVGKAVDVDGGPLPGAHVLLTDNFGNEIQATITDLEGMFRMEAVMNERYRVKISFLGFEELEKGILTNNPISNLGNLTLKRSNVELEEVEVKEKVVIATQKEDTLSFNADAFKTLPDASAEELVEKMPTVVIEDGKVQAQGEDVQQVLVDGRPFFGNDPTAALRNLPAEVVDKIQIFDQASDQAQFTGFDDGETSKTMNIITRLKMRNGQFGKVYAGYGYELKGSEDNEGKYQVGGSLNFFDGDRRVSIIGLSNNINQQNFATEDLLGVVGSSGRRGRGGFGGRGGGGPRGGGGDRGGGRGGRGGGGATASDFLVGQQGGIATTHALGINYSDKWGKKFDVSGSYFFNMSENEAIESLNREFVDVAEVSEIYREANNSITDNFNHRLNFRLEYELDESNSIIMRPRISIQDNNGLSNTFGQTFLGDVLWNQTDNDYRSELSGINFSNSLLFRHRFAKRRRTLSVNFNTTYNEKTGVSFLNSEDLFFSDDTMELIDQLADLGIEGWNLSSNVMYTEPVGKNSMLMLNYRISWQMDDSDKKTFDFDEDAADYEDLNNSLSNVFSNDFVTNEAGAGYNYRKGATMIMTRGSLQWAQLDNEQFFPTVAETNNNFTSILPFVMVRHNFSRMKNLRVFYRTNTRLPTVEQLQNVVDNSNPLQLSIGNPDLRQQYQQNLSLRYSSTNTEKSTVFFTMLSGGTTKNYIANSTYLAGTEHPIFAELELDAGSQLTQPVNLDGYWNIRSFTTFGVPLNRIKSNLNINLTGNYARIPGIINDALNFSSNTTAGLGLVLSSNVSDKVDFTISSRSSYNIVHNSLQTDLNANYLQQNSRLKFNWIIGEGIVFRTDFTHQFYDGLADDFDQSFFVWNMSLGQKVFKNKRGEIALAIYDLLDQNNRISRTITETYIEDTQTNILQRFVMLNFTYNLRNFYSKK